MDKKQTIAYYTLCLNEIKIIDWAIDYWKLFADHVFVFDNGSTDGTLERLLQYPDWITVYSYKTEGTDNDVMCWIKSQCLQHAKDNGFDWAIISDFDEFLYCDDWQRELKNAVDNNVGIIRNQIYQLISLKFPEYDSEKLLHRYPDVKGYSDIEYGKICCVNTHLVDEIRYSPGCHSIDYNGNCELQEFKNVYMFHAKNIGLAYLLERNVYLGSILSENDLQKRYGIHYLFSMADQINNFMDNYVRGSNDINNI